MKRESPALAGLDEMTTLMTRFTSADGIHPTAIPRLWLSRFGQAGEPVPAVYPPSLCVIAQGSKVLMLRDERYVYNRSRFIVASVDLPLTGQVLQATPD